MIKELDGWLFFSLIEIYLQNIKLIRKYLFQLYFHLNHMKIYG